MACDDQKNLASFIKQLHSDLRNNAKLNGTESAWTEHCQQEQLLKKYAKYMHELAKYWENNSNNPNHIGTHSRIQWSIEQCNLYFNNGKQYHRRREIEISKKINCLTDFDLQTLENDVKPLKLLDVGSCYNPFESYEIFDVTAIDICPATKNVKKCDFLNVECSHTELDSKENKFEITRLNKNSFDVVVFSLLLEYLPSSNQRFLCCVKAYNLLKTEGILIIITPDSKHVGANAKLMKIWRYTLANIGFMRIKYEKLKHLHCLVFRKCIIPEVPKHWMKISCLENVKLDELNIPQDFNTNTTNISATVTSNKTVPCIPDLFLELPNFFE